MNTSPPKKFETCAHCGRTDVGSLNAGYGTVRGLALCQPTVNNRPVCYDLVSRFRHPTPCSCNRGKP